MSNFQQIQGGLTGASQANELAQEGLDRLQQQKEELEEQQQQVKDSLAQAGELLGGSLTEKGLESVIKRGIKLGRDKLKKLGLDTEEFEKLAQDYKEGGTRKMVDGLIQRGVKTKEQAQKLIEKFKSKLDDINIPSRPDNISTDDFGLPNIKSDIPAEAPIQEVRLVKGGGEFKPSQRMLDPDFELGRYKIKSEEGQLKIVDRETGDDIEPDQFAKTDFNIPKTPFQEAPDPLETLSRNPEGLQQFHDRMKSMGLDNDTEVKPIDVSTFEYKRPIQPRPSLPETPDSGRIGDVNNLPDEFKSSGYDSNLSSLRDYGRNISKAFFGEKLDENRIANLNARRSVIETRKADLDSDSFRSIYKNALRKQPKRRLINGQPDLDQEEKIVSFRENALDNVEKLQDEARQSETAQRLGITQKQEEPKPDPGTEDFTPSTAEQTKPLDPFTKAGDEYNITPEMRQFLEPDEGSNNLTDLNFGSDNSNPFSNVGRVFNTSDNPIPVKQVNDTLGELPNVGESTNIDLDEFGLPKLPPALQAKIDPTDFIKGGQTASDAVAEGTSDAVKSAITSGVEKAGAEAGEIVSAGGGPEDPISDVIGAVVGIGTLIGSIFGDKPKPPPPPPKITPIGFTQQIGAEA